MEFMSSLQDGIDDQKPSLFELLSENQLAALIPPSLRYLLTIATHRRPRYLLRVLNSFDEIYALLMLAVERHFLKTYGGSFTENFYSLKRERVLQIKGGEAPRARLGAPDLMKETLRLKDRDVWNNLAILVGLPYLKRKLDESYDLHAPPSVIIGQSYNQESLAHDATFGQRIIYYYKWFLRKVYPSINAAYYFSLLAFNLAYLFDNTRYSSPLFWLIGVRIRRLGEADHRAIALAAEQPMKRTRARPSQGSSLFNPSTFASVVYPRFLSSLRLLLPTSAFALKFLEWWHASDFAHQLSKKATESLDLPPPSISGLPAPQPDSLHSMTSHADSTNLKMDATNTVALASAPPPSSLKPTQQQPNRHKHHSPLASKTHHPIYTVPPPTPTTSSLCPICLHPVQTPTSAQTGYVFCYTCIFKWVDGSHQRQIAFMEGGSGGDARWDEDDEGLEGEEGSEGGEKVEASGSREGKWESGKGRCAVTGRRVLGGVEGLRRVLV